MLPAQLAADELQVFSYDALGRLVKVTRAGTVNNNATECYTYDPASNRSNVTVNTASNCTLGSATLSVGSASATEGGNLAFVVSLSGTITGNVTVNYTTANGTATSGSDYTAKSGTLTFTASPGSQTVTVVTLDDAVGEGDETVLFNLSGATGATISTSQGIGTITDNDGACSGVSFTIASNGAVTEGTSSVFTVTKAGTTGSSCSVNYATANGSAIAGSDYTAKSGTLSFTSSQTSKTVSVSTTNDTAVESAETFSMSPSAPTNGATLGSPSSATATINDNDTGGTNQPPVTTFDNAGNMSCGDIITVDVVANDTDPEGNYPLSLVSASGVPGITVSVFSSTEIRIISSGNSSGTKSFSYVVQDSLGAQSTGSGSVNVLAPCQ